MGAGGRTPHLTDAALRALVTGEQRVSPEAGAHFLTCASCRNRARELEPDRTAWVLGGIDRLEDTATHLFRVDAGRLSDTFRKLEDQRARTQHLVNQLANSKDPSSLVLDSDVDPLFLGASVLEWAPPVRQDDPRKIVRLCRIAIKRLNPQADEGRVAARALMAQLKAEEGNAYRILARPVDAGASIIEALDLSEDCADPLAVAFILLFASAHFNDVRRFEVAERLAKRSLRLYRRYGRSKAAEMAEWYLAYIPFCKGDFDKARSRFSCFLATEPEDKTCLLGAVFHLIKIHVMEDDTFGAGRLLTRLRSLANNWQHSEGINIKMRWLRALILGSVGQPEKGAEMLQAVRQYYLDQDILFDAALVSVDLAYLLLKAGEKDDAAVAAAEALEAFRAERYDYPQAYAAILLLKEASRPEGELSQ